MLGKVKSFDCKNVTVGFRGVGLFIGLEIVKDKYSREPHPQLAFRIIKRWPVHSMCVN